MLMGSGNIPALRQRHSVTSEIPSSRLQTRAATSSVSTDLLTGWGRYPSPTGRKTERLHLGPSREWTWVWGSLGRGVSFVVSLFLFTTPQRYYPCYGGAIDRNTNQISVNQRRFECLKVTDGSRFGPRPHGWARAVERSRGTSPRECVGFFSGQMLPQTPSTERSELR
jgi:hypothetical protein